MIPDSLTAERRRATTLVLIMGFLGISLCARAAAAASPDPELERATFRVLDGFDVQLFASERDGAVKPISIRFDPDGRLWMVGSTQYPQIRPGEIPNDKITIFEDTDGDGRADRSTVFADGLLLPLGLELGDGGAYVASATELLHLRDTDGDGRADERRTVFRGFGTGDAHQTINSFAWGPSGELMISQGLHANSRVETAWGLVELRQAGLFRMWPKRLQLEPIWTGAMGAHNPYGTAFDTWGQPFVFAGNGHGIYHLTPALIPTDHFQLHPSLWQKGRKFGGADFVENAHWPTEHQGEAITGGYLHNAVERFRFSDAGSTFKVEQLPPLIESTNTAFRIVDVRFGPDGALYLCDWYNALIGHYQTSLRHPDRDHVTGRIWRVTAKGRPLVRWRKLGAEPASTLFEALRSGDRWTRQMAKRVLADRPADQVIPALRSWLASAGSADTRIRFEALGLFVAHETVEAGVLSQLVKAPEPEVRAYAARVVGHWATRLDRPLDWLAPLVTDPHPRVRLEAIVACAYVPDPRAVELAARATDLPMDNHLEYAFTQAVHALKPRWRELERLGRLTFDGRPGRAAAFAKADGSGDTVAESAARLARIGEVALTREDIERLAFNVARAGGPKDLPTLLRPRSFVVGTEHLAGLQAEVLDGLWRRLRSEPILPAGDISALLGPLLGHADPALRRVAMRLAGIWNVDSARDGIARIAVDDGADLATRAAAMAALGGYAKQDDRALLGTLAVNAAPAELRADAILALTRLDPVAAAGPAARWFQSAEAEASMVRRSGEPDRILTSFLARRGGVPALAAAIRELMPARAVAQRLLDDLASAGRRDAELVRVLEKAAGASAAAPVTLADIPALGTRVRAEGRKELGKQIFERESLACVRCHAVDGTPGKPGPDLGAIGTAQTLEYILGAIIEPQKEVKEGFAAHEIETRAGDVLQGYVRGESETELTVDDHLSGRVVRVPMNQITSRRALGSIMPPGLADVLTREELRDLASYLSSLGRRD